MWHRESSKIGLFQIPCAGEEGKKKKKILGKPKLSDSPCFVIKFYCIEGGKQMENHLPKIALQQTANPQILWIKDQQC